MPVCSPQGAKMLLFVWTGEAEPGRLHEGKGNAVRSRVDMSGDKPECVRPIQR